MMTTESTDARRDRQRIWSAWLDEVPPALHFDYEDDRDELARLIAEVVAEAPSDDAGMASSDLGHDERGRRRCWRAWLDRLPTDLELEIGDHRERLASRLADAVPTAPQKGSWGGWLPIRPPPPTSTVDDGELRARLGAVATVGRGRGRRMVLEYLARQGLDLVRVGVARCGESLFAFAALLERAATAEPLLPELASRLGQPIDELRAFLDGDYRPEIERALDPHVDCHLRENCGAADCPPANAERKRAHDKAGAWSPLVLGIDGGGRRHFLDGEPVSCGTTLELQAIGDRSDDYGEYSVPLPRGERVRYEAQLSREDAPATLHTYVGGHEFIAHLEPWMRFRWPGRTN
jgi:hypothetical protein